MLTASPCPVDQKARKGPRDQRAIFGVAPRAGFERINMLPAPPRTTSGRRVYGADEARILFIRRSRELGFSLDEIRTLLQLGGPEKASCRAVREIAAHHLESIRAKLRT